MPFLSAYAKPGCTSGRDMVVLALKKGRKVMENPYLAAIHTYPVKSLHGGVWAEIDVEAPGLAGDRRWMIVQPGGRFRTFRETPRFADLAAEGTDTGVRLIRRSDGAVLDVPFPEAGASEVRVTVFRAFVPARDAGDAAARFLNEATGLPLRLVHMHDPAARPVDPFSETPGDVVSFADGYPILLTTTASLDALNGALAMPVEMRRFRPNLVIEGAHSWAEDDWRRIRIGEVTFRVAKPCERCVMTTRDPDTGVQTDPAEPLDTLRKLHSNLGRQPCFGQNLIPDGVGRIAVGDPVEVLESGPSNLR